MRLVVNSRFIALGGGLGSSSVVAVRYANGG